MSIRLKKRKLKEGRTFRVSDEVCKDVPVSEENHGFAKEQKPNKEDRGKKIRKVTSKKKGKTEKGSEAGLRSDNQLSNDGKGSNELNSSVLTGSECAKESSHSERRSKTARRAGSEEQDRPERIKHKKVKKDKKSKRKDVHVPIEEKEEDSNETITEKVDEILGVDEDCSRGMKKWLIEYKQSRPGLKVLQERIDEFIAAREAQQEQARKEREALSAEGGWTVVVHHKGRKKTTDSESGTVVGSIAEAAVMDKMANKKTKELQDFYRFQKREARRNEVMMLQSKFEQDRKRIQELRAARKFRPY